MAGPDPAIHVFCLRGPVILSSIRATVACSRQAPMRMSLVSSHIPAFESAMARISYIEENDHPELTDLIGKIRAGRRGALINVYKLLLHSPALAAIWLEFVGAARFKVELEGRLREIVIVRVAHLNRTAYVFKQHVPQLSAPEGLNDAECDALADWRNAKTFSLRERAALAYTDAMTRDIAVPDDVFEALRAHFNERQIVELSVLIGLYNMHTRVFTALGIDPEPHHR